MRRDQDGHNARAASLKGGEELPRGEVPSQQDQEHRAGFQRLGGEIFRGVSGKRILRGYRGQGELVKQRVAIAVRFAVRGESRDVSADCKHVDVVRHRGQRLRN